MVQSAAPKIDADSYQHRLLADLAELYEKHPHGHRLWGGIGANPKIIDGLRALEDRKWVEWTADRGGVRLTAIGFEQYLAIGKLVLDPVEHLAEMRKVD